MGCRVKKSPKNKAGQVRLAFRLIFRGPGGEEIRSWEGTEEEATPANEKLLKAKAILIEDEIKKGTFDYLKHFPHGNKAGLFVTQAVAERFPIRTGYEKWIETKKPPLVRKSRRRDYQQHFAAYLLNEIGAELHENITVEKLTWLRARLLDRAAGYGLSIKTAKDVIGSTLRAYWRDLPSIGVSCHNPFNDLPDKWWPKISRPEPDPFTEEEREAIIDYVREKGRYWQFIFFQFHEGTRPSEAAALRLRHIDIKNNKIVIARSRHLGEENLPKTARAADTIILFPHVAKVIEPLIPLHADPDMYLFRNSKGGPVDPDDIRKSVFNPALRVKGIRQRDFYHTKDTFISLALSKNLPSKWVAEHCRISLVTIEQDYGKWISGAGIDPIAVLSGMDTAQSRASAKAGS